ncbi:MAG: M48 family metallopeptidase [Saprospiraceae bacterium]|nr:M48 family metallopeptidase [Saprospiraceae bacterium]
MITREQIMIGNVEIDVVRKDIKNMHLAVYPPNGRIRLAAPIKTDHEVVRLFAISKLGWIKKHVKSFQDQRRETPRSYVSGESHYYQGKRYLLEVIERKGINKIELSGNKKIKMYVRPGTTESIRAQVMKEWYRKQLKAQIPELLEKWEKIIGVTSNDWGVKQMRTKWGACNSDVKRIWLNLELAKKPPICLEYIIVHELVHLLERHHNNRFGAYMDKFMPKWRLYRDQLNELPVAHGDWGY